MSVLFVAESHPWLGFWRESMHLEYRDAKELQLHRVYARAVRQHLGQALAQVRKHLHPPDDWVGHCCALPVGGRNGRGVSPRAASVKDGGLDDRCSGRRVVLHASQAAQSLVGGDVGAVRSRRGFHLFFCS